VVILRVFNVYGPGQPLPPSHAPVVPRFLRQATSGGSVVIFGHGRQTRDFVYISDVVEALLRAGQTQGISRLIFNIGSGTEVSILGLVDAIERVLGRSAHRLPNGEGDAGVTRLCADISLAKESLGFTPKVSLEEGLRMMISQEPRFQICER
jgi:UDP-glucose 4-epimerase